MKLNMNTLSALDSPLFGGSFSTPQMRELFSAEQYLVHCVEVEVALAKAQARLGIIPEAAASKISRAAENCSFDMEVLSRETENVGYPILPLVEQLSHQGGGGRAISTLGCHYPGYHG